MQKKLCTIFIFISLLLFLQQSFAQQEILTFKQSTIDDGLSQNSVTCIYQDKLGFMWFGTQDGLNRYDGYTYTQFRNERGNPNSISNNYIWDLYEDDDHVLWIATFGGGLNSLDLQTGVIHRYKLNPDDPASFPSNRLFSITEYPNGTLWLGANEGLIKFDKSSGESELFLSHKNSDKTLRDNYIGIVTADDSGNLWLRSDSGLTRFHTKTHQTVYYQRSPYSNSVSLGNVSDIQFVNGKLLVSCTTGLLQIDPKQETDTLLLDASSIQMDDRTPGFRNVLPLNNKRFAIGTNIGLLIFDSKSGKISTFQSDATDDKSLSHSNVLSLLKSDDGVIWIGTRNGLNKIEQEKPDFIHIRNIAGKKGLSSKNVNSFMEENDSLFWISTTDGLNLYDKKNNSFTVFRKEDSKNNELQTNYVLCLFKDSKGNKWMGTRSNGFYKIDSGNKITRIKPANATVNKTSIHFITEDKEGFIWLGTGGAGLWKYDVQKNTIKKYGPAKDGTGTSHSYVFTILQDSFDNLWFGTPTGGLNLFDPKTERFIYFLNNPENKNSLSNDIILSLYEDGQNNLWIGTNGGLNKLIPKLKSNMFDVLSSEKERKNDSLFVNFGQEQGFPNDVIYGILEDSHRNLWMSTNKGLVAFDIKTEQVVKTFDVSQGIQSNEFNQNGYYKDRKGLFYFGGVDGFNIFHPDSLVGNQFVPPVVLTGMSLFNEPVKVENLISDTKEVTLTKNLPYLKAISLSWKHDMITFNFAGLSFISPEKNTYRYMLKGFNEDWVAAGYDRSATYTNLDPGDYIFKVQAANSSGIWNETGASLNVHISNPPWLRWYAYLAYFLLLSGLFYLFVRHRINQATQKIKVQAQIDKARTQEREAFRKRSSRDFHDEAGTKITRIALISELVKLNTEDKPEVQNHLKQIEENLQDLNAGMRDFIWALDPTKDNAYETLTRYTEFAGNFCEYANIQFKSEPISESLKTKELNMAERRHLLMILKEATNNCVKHGKPTTLHFYIQHQPGKLTLRLKDNGSGFDIDQENTGNGLNNMRERAEALGGALKIKSKTNGGTTLTLTLETTRLGN
ncbi:MAG: hypothetical protein K8F54_11560 [Altibacter sp.]|uniref:sensor histidine kinase n=1 Tax=Altibacter sp. TaxID=2024823 RepID=UPI001D65F557|nr:sensor histidine kinase [Altibacter sp.]MBZ0328236.1 hypothetical protein [Altibacter sp.]